jgi:hypothetical protein
MWSDPDAAPMRQHQREAARRRHCDRQREDLIAAARVLIPAHGLAIALGRIAVHAGLTRHAAAGLFNATSDLATELVRRAWLALTEQLAPQPGATPEQLLTRLIEAIRADAPAHLVQSALGCGATQWQRDILDHAEAILALTLTEALCHAAPHLAPAGPQLGHMVLTLARDAALAPHAPDARAEAVVITAMLGAPAAAAVSLPAPDGPAAPGELRPAPTHLRLVPRSDDRTRRRLSPRRPRVHDPPAGSA